MHLLNQPEIPFFWNQNPTEHSCALADRVNGSYSFQMLSFVLFLFGFQPEKHITSNNMCEGTHNNL